MTWAEPTFPPLLDGRVVIEGGCPRDLAIAGAQNGELGAGDTLWLQDAAQTELAIVLEPDFPLVKSAQMLPLAMAAAGDCLGALLPPQVAVHFRWPGTILLNGAAAGECTLTAPAGCASADVPAWMVLEFSLRHAFGATPEHDFDATVDADTAPAQEPGATPGITSLVEEGGEELSTVDVMESFTRHFLSLLDTWNNDGFADVADNWRGRVEGLDESAVIAHPTGTITARVLALDEDGNLLVRPEGGGSTSALALADYIQYCAIAS